YKVEVSGSATKGYTVTNSHTPATVDISGTKTWSDKDDQDGKRPAAITVYLMNGTKVVDTAKVTAEDDWKYEFKDLPKFEKGTEINYTIFEDAVDDYSTEVNGFDLTNTHTPGKTSINVAKDWDDKDNQDGKRPDEVIIGLYADIYVTDENPEGEVPDVDPIVLNAENKWQGEFTELDEYKEGKSIEYTVQEKDVTAGYTAKVKKGSDGNFVITNSYMPETKKMLGTKTCNDSNDQDGKSPGMITVHLLKDTEVINTAKLTAANYWKYEFKNLTKYEDGEEINYTIAEDTVKDYSPAYKST